MMRSGSMFSCRSIFGRSRMRWHAPLGRSSILSPIFRGSEAVDPGSRDSRSGCMAQKVANVSVVRWQSNQAATRSTAAALSGRDLALVGASTLLPSIAFGFMDNAIMILAGDQIDEALGLKFGLSTLAAAGLGNLISDVVGSASEGVIERNVKTPMPVITEEQRRQKPFQYALNFGRLIGIAIGCLLGMFPLLLRFPDEVQTYIDSLKRSIGLVPISDSLSEQLKNRTQRYCGDLRQASGLLGADDAALLVVDTRSKRPQLYTMHHDDKALIAERNEEGCVVGVRPGHTIKASSRGEDSDGSRGAATGAHASSSSDAQSTEPLERRPARRVLLGEVGFAHTLDFDDSEDLPVATTVRALSAQAQEQRTAVASGEAQAGTEGLVVPPIVSTFAELNDLALRTAADGHARQLRLIVGGESGSQEDSPSDGKARVSAWLSSDPPPAWLHPVLVEAASSRLHGGQEPLQQGGVAILLRPVRDTHGRILGVVALLESHPYTSSKHGSRHRRPKLAAKTRGAPDMAQRTAPWWELDLAGDSSAALEAQRLAVVSTHVSMALDRLNRLQPTKADIESRPVDLEAALQLVATN